MKERFNDDNFVLLRALHHVKIALEYFDDLSKNYDYGVKHVINGYSSKCKWILDNIRHRLPHEVLVEIDKDMRDSLYLDAIEEKIITFNESQRNSLEEIIDLMSNGELIQITDEKATINGG